MTVDIRPAEHLPQVKLGHGAPSHWNLAASPSEPPIKTHISGIGPRDPDSGSLSTAWDFVHGQFLAFAHLHFHECSRHPQQENWKLPDSSDKGHSLLFLEKNTFGNYQAPALMTIQGENPTVFQIL